MQACWGETSTAPMTKALRSPTFEITDENLHLRFAGQNVIVRLIIDGYDMNMVHTLLFKGSILKGTVTEVDVRGAVLALADGLEGHLRASEMSRERVEDARTLVSVGDEIEARFVSMDRKTRVISLSIKAKEAREEADAVQSYQSSDAGPVSSGTTLGDLLKEQMGSDES